MVRFFCSPVRNFLTLCLPTPMHCRENPKKWVHLLIACNTAPPAKTQNFQQGAQDWPTGSGKFLSAPINYAK